MNGISRMETHLTHDNDAARVKLSGELDIHSSPDLRKTLLDLVDRKPPSIVVDLEAVTYIDSSGLATLIECMRGVKTYQGELLLVGVNARIWPIFKLAGLDRVFDIRRSQPAGADS